MQEKRLLARRALAALPVALAVLLAGAPSSGVASSSPTLSAPDRNLAAASSSSQVIPPRIRLTTLHRTIAADPDGNLVLGPGEPRLTRTLDWDDPGGRGRPLAGFKQISDVHAIDEQSPGRVEFFDECGPGFTSAWRPQEAASLHVGEMMLRRLARIRRGPATQAPLRFVISTGDNVDNNQLNETRWFIRLLDGNRINPNSGVHPEGHPLEGQRVRSYDGVTQEQTPDAWPQRILGMAQRPFNTTGTGVRWLAVLGNHDGLVQGNVNALDLPEAFLAIPVRGRKIFIPFDDFDDCPESTTDLETIEGVIIRAITGGRERPVPEDPRRRFITHEELIDQYFRTTGRPVGHGFQRAPQDPVLGTTAGYYEFPVSPQVRGISLDSIAQHGGSQGSIPHTQFEFLEEQLRRWSTTFYDEEGVEQRNDDGDDRLIVVFSHHSSTTMQNAGDPESPFAPFHCFSRDDSPACSQAEGLRELFHRFPNVILWVNGHEHNNAIRPFQPPEGADPARGFWEINTAAHIDWPQQSRLIEIAFQPGAAGEPDTVFVYGTMVDQGGSVTPNEDRQRRVPFLASLSREEAHHDACIRAGQADCGATGTELDRNVKLVIKAPFRIPR